MGTSLLKWFPAKSDFKSRLAFTNPTAVGNLLILADLQGYKLPPGMCCALGHCPEQWERVITLFHCRSLSYQSIWFSSLNFKMEICVNMKEQSFHQTWSHPSMDILILGNYQAINLKNAFKTLTCAFFQSLVWEHPGDNMRKIYKQFYLYLKEWKLTQL